MIVIGLTGSIAMGKSTVGSMMKTMHIPVHESDHAAHKCLRRDHEARTAIAALFPYYEYPEIYIKGTYDIKRKEFGQLIFHNEYLRQQLEAIIHPFVQEEQRDFIRQCKLKGRQIVCLDIPLLFETDAQSRVDYTITASAPYLIQKQRVMERAGMSEEKFEKILERQLPDSEKCARSDYVIKTGIGRAHAMKQLKHIITDIKIKSGLLPDPSEEVEEIQRY